MAAAYLGAAAGDGVWRAGGASRFRLPAHRYAELPASPRRPGRIPGRVHLALPHPGHLPARPDARAADRARTVRRAPRGDRIRGLPAPDPVSPPRARWPLTG